MQAKQNLELKHFCADFPAIRKTLKALGAKKEVVKKQKDYFFALPTTQKAKKGRLKLRVEKERTLLVYYERPDFVAGRDTASDIALLPADTQTLTFLKKSLGVTAVVEKTREVWRKGNTIFHLDTVKGVGKLFEIELQKRSAITERDKKIFASYQSKLLPHLGRVVQGSNIDLVQKVQR